MKYRALAAIIALLIGGGLYYYGTPETPAEKPIEKEIPQPAPNRGFGIIDMEKIKVAHPDGEQLDFLLAKEIRLRLELNEAMRISQLPKPQPPETNKEVFDEAAWQKNAQIVVSQLAELESKKKAAADEYRKNSEPRYLEERDKIIAEYLNENLNIRLKLQNVDNLRLTPEQVDELNKRLDELELERNKLQFELKNKWLAEIAKYAEDSVAEEEASLRAEAERLRLEVEEQTRQKKSDVAERNKRIMESSLHEMENRQHRRQEIFIELQTVGKERAALEEKILMSIVDKATMLAAFNHLEMVLVKRESFPSDKVLSRGVEKNFEFKSPEHVGAIIIAGKNSKDLTDDLIKEMNRR